MGPILYNSLRYKRIYMDLPKMGKSVQMDYIKDADMMLNALGRSS